ncbi:MAG: YhgN family NAAT transporter [Simkaniaceae bacterium]|nr:YhgN family NAAT transporter [Simkaniaceae bacterium]
MSWSHFFSLALSLFLLMDPIGNIPFYISILKHVEAKQQKRIIARELIIALFTILFFAFLGDVILTVLHISTPTLSIAGGTILFLIALKMIFPSNDSPFHTSEITKEPFIVPLAIPLVAGPSILATVMIYAKQEIHSLYLAGAIIVAWLISFSILIFSNQIQKTLKQKGLEACERLMGLVLILLSTEMFMEGIKAFIRSIYTVHQ